MALFDLVADITSFDKVGGFAILYLSDELEPLALVDTIIVPTSYDSFGFLVNSRSKGRVFELLSIDLLPLR